MRCRFTTAFILTACSHGLSFTARARFVGVSYLLWMRRQMVGLLRQAAAARVLRAPMETEMMMVIGACSIPWKLSHLVLNIAEQLIGAREDDERNISF
ncbi:hypothetical protein F2Q68_00045854 [Brassica cretica]|uniref:Uncharacterized protein n=1 Tax=Brassica cretica TaxID=69181 RepID=A0A8S9LLE9_BRACR|nr:hypothetical protein F2Q68_00045854 [Brassica cretica]